MRRWTIHVRPPSSRSRRYFPRLSSSCTSATEVESLEVEIAGTSAAPSTTRKSTRRGRAELVVHLPLLFIAEDVMRLLQILEAILGRLVAWVDVWVKLARKTTVGFANLVRGSRSLHP